MSEAMVAAEQAMRALYGKTDKQRFEESWAQFKREHRLDFMAYRIAGERDRWSMYDCLKRQWSEKNPELSDFYCRAAIRIAEELRV